MQEEYMQKNKTKLRCGYTTGTCATAAAKAAAVVLLLPEKRAKIVSEGIRIITPKGVTIRLPFMCCAESEQSVTCAVRKDAGDDADITDGVLVYAKVGRMVSKYAESITIDGGIGIGRVTKPGLDQPVGNAAINRIPRIMMEEAVREVCEEAGYEGGLQIEISIPEGIELAKQTFNPRLGIEGGISVLGTSGIVEPMSEKALVDTIEVCIRSQIAQGKEYLLITPGNYGANYIRKELKLELGEAVKCSNFVGEMLDFAVEYQARGILLVGHIGKLIKLAGGIMNTHSKNADARMEIMTAYAALAGTDSKTLERIMQAVTTEEGLYILKESGKLEKTLSYILKQIEFHIRKRTEDLLEIGVILFSNEFGLLAENEEAKKMIEKV